MEFLGTWESIYNPNFNSVEFGGFRKNAGLHTFTLSVTEWCEKTNAILESHNAELIKEGKSKE